MYVCIQGENFMRAPLSDGDKYIMWMVGFICWENHNNLADYHENQSKSQSEELEVVATEIVLLNKTIT